LQLSTHFDVVIFSFCLPAWALVSVTIDSFSEVSVAFLSTIGWCWFVAIPPTILFANAAGFGATGPVSPFSELTIHWAELSVTGSLFLFVALAIRSPK